MLGAEANKEIGRRERVRDDSNWMEAQAQKKEKNMGPESKQTTSRPERDEKDISRLMSKVDIVSPRPQQQDIKASPVMGSPGRTPSPKMETAISRLRADQMDALPPGSRTPRKSPGTIMKFNTRHFVDLEPLPKFVDVSESQWTKLFSKKISQCELVFDFGGPLCDIRNKECKTTALNEILWVISEHGPSLSEQQYQEVFLMFAKNIFRCLPPRQNPIGDAFDPEDDEPVYDPNWPHFHIIYEIFIRLVESPSFNVNIARKFIDQIFVHRLLALFDVEDPRERDMVKTAVHRVYGKFLNLRAFIRKAMRHIFYEFVYEDERHNIAEMLEILGSVVNGFAVPLREEHKIFLEKTLIPLHKNRLLPLYYQQLSLCIVQFAEKDCQLVEKIILGLLRIWPKINTTKEIMFLNEIEEVLDTTPQECFPKFMIPLCHQLSRSISNPHFQVAERALQYWNNEYIISFVAENCEIILPIVLPAMLQYSRSHWNKNVQLQVFNGLRLFMDMNPRLYERISSARDDNVVDRSSLWTRVEQLARRNSRESSKTQLARDQIVSSPAQVDADLSRRSGGASLRAAPS